jgi:hypothetical protein
MHHVIFHALKVSSYELNWNLILVIYNISLM